MWSIMGVPVVLWLLLILQIFTGSTSGTFVTSCDSCHEEATCLESQERGDSFNKHFTSQPFCVCKHGFVGDGVTCYNKKLCSSSSCCRQGYHWSADSGCVDTDECSLPGSTCAPSQICRNMPGSFECLQPSSSARLGPSSQSVLFSCGHTVCPSGMDCISFNGTLRCADPCEHYSVLNDEWRSTNNTESEDIHCDQYVDWQGWYRLFLGNISAHIPQRCVPEYRCGTHATLWITAPHPTQPDEIVNRTVCSSWGGNCCHFDSHTISVKLCNENFYVYKLVRPSVCNLAYCAEVNGIYPDSTTTHGPETQTYATSQVSETPGTTTSSISGNPDFITSTTTANNSTGVEGEIRLVNGGNSSSCSGRVEIFLHGQWGTVCDDIWNLDNAQVVCRQLGCGRVVSAPTQAYFGYGSGPIWLDSVRCTGSESKLTECSHQGIGSHDCRHSEDAGVVCEAASPVRLVNSHNRCSGRVEVYHAGQWGTVCDDGWGLSDANVVCRQLDCGPARAAPQNATFGQGSGPIWLDDVSCSGNELSITDCRHQGFGVHNCVHREDASVVCEAHSSLLQASELICTRKTIQVGLDLAYLTSSGLNPYSGNLAVHNCSAAGVHDGSVWYEVEPVEGACGTTFSTNGTHAFYSNSLFLYPHNASFAPAVSLPFTCSYPLDTETRLDVAIRPYLMLEDGILGQSVEKVRAFMSLFRDSSYIQKYPSGTVTLPVGSPLYVGVSVDEGNPRFAVVLQDCYFTRSSNPQDPLRHSLIQNKCSADRQQVLVTQSGTSLQARFTALFFLFQEHYQSVYLHCSLRLCDQSSYSCVPSCTRRKRRSVSSSDLKEPYTIGPIIWEKSPEISGNI